MITARSITSFITTRLLLLFAAIVLCYSLIVNHVYLWGMDEATEYYMFVEAEIILDSYQPGELIPDNIAGFREYYWPDRLPEAYKKRFPLHKTSINQFLFEQVKGTATYLLPAKLSETAQAIDLYVVHILPDVAPTDDRQSQIRQILITLAIVTLLLLLLLIGWFVYRIVNATKALSLWAQQLNSENHDSLRPPDSALYFTELKTVAGKLATSFSELAKFNQREQQFLRSLSHELRTPIAVTSAALDVLDKKAKDDGVAKWIGKIRRASNTMRALTETILWLWRDPSGETASSKIAIKPIIDQSIADNQYLLKNKSGTVDNQLDAQTSLLIEKPLLTIVCNNLIRNAFQYCDEGVVNIAGDENSLVVSNVYSVIDSGTEQQSTEADYGFGLGLLIVQRIVDNNGWFLRIDKQSGTFAVEVRFIG